uniref:uncharacterized protein LOC132684334 n=1 Tax=Panthera onca TaxID=9690 RepID=UPI0029547BB0|nr:uncharacterized protein LOC132684334 [Panthera onca]
MWRELRKRSGSAGPRVVRASELRARCALSPLPRPNLVPQTLCFPFRGSSAERVRANQPLTPFLPDFSTFPPLEGVSAVGRRSRCGASLAAADHSNRSGRPNLPTRASASTLWPPSLFRVLVRQKRASQQLRRVTSGWIRAGARRRGSLRSSRRRAAVTSRWRSQALSQSWALGFWGLGALLACPRRGGVGPCAPSGPRAERRAATSTAARGARRADCSPHASRPLAAPTPRRRSSRWEAADSLATRLLFFMIYGTYTWSGFR